MSAPTFRIEDGIAWVGDRSFPWAQIRHETHQDHRTRGFHIRFESGWLLSVTFGSGSYCENHFTGFPGEDEFTETPEHAEIGMWDDAHDGHLVELFGDSVEGWCTPDYVLAVADLLAAGDYDGVLALGPSREFVA